MSPFPFVKCLFWLWVDLSLARALSGTEKGLSCVVVRIMLLKCAWCIIWLHLNAGGQLCGCLKVAFPHVCVSWLCVWDSSGIVSAIYKRSLYDVCKGILLIEKYKLNYSEVV